MLLFEFIVLYLTISTVYSTSTIPLNISVSNLPWLCLHTVSGTPVVGKCGLYDTFTTKARYLSSATQIGWNYLEIKGGYSNSWYELGYLEGYLTADKITLFLKKQWPTYGKADMDWVKKHRQYMTTQAHLQRHVSQFWKQIYHILQQLDGMADGYNQATGSAMSSLDIFMINFRIEMEDIAIATKIQQGITVDLTERQYLFRSHCSGLIKVLSDDLYISHDAWNDYSTMSNRFYKVYDMPSYPRIAMSSYIATIFSFDDWYQIKGLNYQLAVIETTNSVFNMKLYKDVVPHTVSEFLRVMTANYLAKNGKQWTELFEFKNSGTYNNQFMILDMSKYQPSQPIKVNTFWVVEQIPGLVVSRDMSSHLQLYGYWASYNIPYFKEIYELSGYPAMVQSEGDFNSYTKYARARIFKRNHTDVHDIPSMMHLMRYNNYKYDPYSRITDCKAANNSTCDPPYSSMLAVSSRGDLMPNYPNNNIAKQHLGINYGGVGFACFGAIDSKIATWKNRYTQHSFVIAGPTSDQHSPFTYGGKCKNTVPGSPDIFNYQWVSFM